MRRASRTRAFTLVEVVLAMGILSVAILVVVGLFGSLSHRATETIERREAVGAMNALSNFVRHEKDFATVFQWAKSSPKNLVFVRYRADAAGAPVATGGTQVRSTWMETPVANKSEFEAAREGRWLAGRLTPSTTLNPALPATAATYTKATLVFNVDVFIVPEPDFSPTGTPLLQGAVAAHKP